MFRKLSLMAALVVLVAAFSVASAQEEITLRYFNFSSAPDHVESLATIIAAFEAENPGIKVESVTAPYNDYFTLLQTDVLSGDVADVFELNYENFVPYATNGLLLDLSGLVSEEAPFYPAALEAFNFDGAQLGLPATFSTVVLFYNADLFDEAGLEYPTNDWTWDDAITAGQAIKALGDDYWGLYSPVQFFEFFKKAGQQGECAFLNEDKTESTINSPACVETLELMLSFVNSGIMPSAAQLSGVKDDQLFLTGKLGIWVSGIWMFTPMAAAEFNWDITVEPMINQHANHFFANAAVVSVSTAHPEAAAKWAEFLTSSEVAAQVRVEKSWELPALDKPEYFSAYLEQTPPANRAAVFEALENPIPVPVIVRQAEFQDLVGAALQQAVDGELTAQEALDQAKAAVDPLLQ